MQNEFQICVLPLQRENTLNMKRLLIHTFEEVHHVCLMYGLKQAYEKFPFLAKNPMATPPPVRRKPERTKPLIGFKNNPAYVQYFKDDIYIVYELEKSSEADAMAFAKAVMEGYLGFRHPYMKSAWEGDILKESASGHVIAEITPELPATCDKL